MLTMRGVLIVNGKARRGREWFEIARRELEARDLELADARLARRPRDLVQGVQEAIANRIPLVCVGGGDGTLSMVAGLFRNSDSVLGLLPMGTGNSLARDLGIPSNLAAATEIATQGKPQSIDLGQVGDTVFVNVATVGLTTLIAENLDPDSKRRFGRAVYLVAMFKAVARGRRFLATLELPDGAQEHRSMQVVVGNGRFHAGPFPITPAAAIDSGRLAGYTVNTSRKAVLLRYALRLWHGSHVDMPEVVPFNVPCVRIATRPIRRITVDGEIKLHTPAEFRSLPGALRVMIQPLRT